MICMGSISKIYDKLRSMIIPFERVLDEIPDKGSVLDIGSSHGTFTIYAARTKRRIRITGVEINGKRVKSARQKARGLKNIEFIDCDFTKFKSGKKFDTVTCLDVLHHTPRILHEKFIEKSHKLLKPEGIFILVEISKKPTPKYLWNYMHDVLFSRTTKLNYVSKEMAVGMVKAHGFSIKSIKTASSFMYVRYMIIAKKS